MDPPASVRRARVCVNISVNFLTLRPYLPGTTSLGACPWGMLDTLAGEQSRRRDVMDDQEPRRRGWFGRILGLAAIGGAAALWRQRQRQRDLDEELWGDPRDLDDPQPPAAPAEEPADTQDTADDA